jgi:hypothetical protein
MVCSMCGNSQLFLATTERNAGEPLFTPGKAEINRVRALSKKQLATRIRSAWVPQANRHHFLLPPDSRYVRRESFH